MKFSEAVRHLENLGLVVEGAASKRQRGRRRLRNPLRVVPVLNAKNGNLPEELIAMIRESRAETSSLPRPRRSR